MNTKKYGNSYYGNNSCLYLQHSFTVFIMLMLMVILYIFILYVKSEKNVSLKIHKRSSFFKKQNKKKVFQGHPFL